MRKSMIRNRVTAGLAVLTAVVMVTGCGNTKGTIAETELTPQTGASEEANAVDAKTDGDSTNADAGFFSQGVYVNYAKDAENPPRTYFYVFNADTYGFTADGEHDDAGVPFSVMQADGKASFSFGGADSDESVLVITGSENGTIYGYFEDAPERELVFEPVSDADPEGFSAVNYLNGAAGEDLVYRDANGWSVRYNPSCITVNGGGPVTTFVYTGDCPGTCMVSATYDVDMDAKAKAEDLAKSYGEKASVTETVFPGTTDVKGYYVDANPGQLGPGMYQSAYVRDHMGGYLVFECITHVAGDDEMDIPISDALAEIIDTLTFD